MWTSLSFLLILCRLWTSQGAKFDPYVDNGGTVVGITGKNYAIIATDTRLSESYVIRSRNITKIFEVSKGVYLAASGCLSDTIALSKVMQSEMKLYEWQNEREPTVSVLAHCLANVLYSRRNFPYFSVCAVAGLDEFGNGALYRYDALGSFERVRAVCAGKGERLIQPILDEITGMEEDDTLFLFPGQPISSMLPVEEGRRKGLMKGKDLNVEEACEIIVTAFKAAAEREISIGDGIDLCIIRGGGDYIDNNDNDHDNDRVSMPEVQEHLGHGHESMMMMTGDDTTTMVGEEAPNTDDSLMTGKYVTRTIDEKKTVVKQKIPRVSIERRSFSLPRH
jgi:20S proteasome subunit beta 6